MNLRASLIVGGIIAFILFIALMFGPAMLGQPPKAEVTEDIQLSQTAFLVPLMGENKDSQAQVTSAEALAKHKVIGKRVTIPLRQMKTGYIAYKWVPSMALIVVDRAPIMELWSRDPFHDDSQSGGGSAAAQPGNIGLALRVQSKDGIKFAVPGEISALIVDDDAALFQSRYRGKSLNDIVNTDVRNYAQSVLSEKFAAVDLETCRRDKVKYIKEAQEKLAAYFKQTGITIEYFGLFEGLIFENRNVQAAIELAYTNNLEGIRLTHSIKAENIRNDTKTETSNIDQEIAAIAETVEEPLRLMRVIELAKKQAALVIAASSKFNASIPTQVLPAGGSNQGLLLQVPTTVAKQGN